MFPCAPPDRCVPHQTELHAAHQCQIHRFTRELNDLVSNQMCCTPHAVAKDTRNDWHRLQPVSSSPTIAVIQAWRYIPSSLEDHYETEISLGGTHDLFL